VEAIANYVASRGYTFEPWQIAAFVTAVRTKPFVILAGISGTGKTRLPQLVAEATGAAHAIVPVRPDWTDSSDLLGYEQLGGSYQPGSLLRFAKQAQSEPDRQFFFVLDEMNIARVEYYLAEVLSRIENRTEQAGRFVTPPLAPSAPTIGGDVWSSVYIPDNLCIVGSVNMDETTFGFSKKVLDRSFVIEFSQIELSDIQEPDPKVGPVTGWTSADWRPAALQLSFHPRRGDARIGQVIENLTEINSELEQAQLQVGYRVRDEIGMFCLAAVECAGMFVTSEQGPVDPLDVAIAMKVLPRIQGSGPSIRRVLEGLRKWATPQATQPSAAPVPQPAVALAAQPTVAPATQPVVADQPGTGSTTGFPFCADRIDLMLRRLNESGYANYWL
jgi:hypothetical protein